MEKPSCCQLNQFIVFIEMHVQQLKHSSLPIPQHLAVLLVNNRRKEEKRKAKRLANRKSATISRARKKAFIDDMTDDNARLRKRAELLKFLPDLVSREEISLPFFILS
jgi:hypothetical protein